MGTTLGAIGLGFCCAQAFAQATFTWCGGIPNGQWLSVRGVAAGGAAIVGTANFPSSGGGTTGHAYRWTPATGIVDLGTLPSTLTFPYSDAYAVSADGAVVAGVSFTSANRCFRWSAATGMVEMPILPGWSSAGATCISADGSVLVGWGSGVARWDSAGVHDLGRPPWRMYPTPWGASADAAVIAGYAYTTFGQDDRAFVLDAAGWTDLGVLPGDTQSRANAVSADGSVVAGYSRGASAAATHAFVWTRAGGLTAIPTPAGITGLYPAAVSGNGSVVLLTPSGSATADGFVWMRSSGVQSVRALLASYGIDLTGWTSVYPTAITADGRTMAGNATGATGYRAWVVTLPEGFGCYANCDSSTATPALNVNDFMCFLNRFAAADPYANCDGSTTAPTLNVLDFTCFLNAFAAGCP